MVDHLELNRIAKEVFGADFRSVDAKFMQFMDLKAKWMRTTTTLDLGVSDYLQYASEDILYQLLETVRNKMLMRDDDQYTEDVIEYLSSAEFRENNRKTYLERNGAVPCPRLADIASRMVDEGLIEDVGDCMFCTGPMDGDLKTSGLFKVLIVNKRAMDTAEEKELREDIYYGIRVSQTRFPDSPKSRKEYIEEMVKKEVI